MVSNSHVLVTKSQGSQITCFSYWITHFSYSIKLFGYWILTFWLPIKPWPRRRWCTHLRGRRKISTRSRRRLMRKSVWNLAAALGWQSSSKATPFGQRTVETAGASLVQRLTRLWRLAPLTTHLRWRRNYDECRVPEAKLRQGGSSSPAKLSRDSTCLGVWETPLPKSWESWPPQRWSKQKLTWLRKCLWSSPQTVSGSFCHRPKRPKPWPLLCNAMSQPKLYLCSTKPPRNCGADMPSIKMTLRQSWYSCDPDRAEDHLKWSDLSCLPIGNAQARGVAACTFAAV